MKKLRSLFLAAACFIPLTSHAVIISDVISVNKTLDIGSLIFDFDLTKHGYNNLTDSINFVELSYDFSKTVDEVDDYDDPSTMETIQFNSYIFDGRTNYYDINPEVITQRTSWNKDDTYCQRENYDNGECELNLDLFGNAEEFLSVYNGKIWLGDVKFSVDVTRTEVPEPSSSILLAMGLFAMFFMRACSVKRKP
jgi:hypothetical protein